MLRCYDPNYEDMETRTKEFAWVAKLSSDNKLVKWSGKSDGTLEQIVLKLAVLGPGAKTGERNIIEMTTFDSEQGKIKSCICSLGVGRAENQQLSDISLYPPVHFTLIEGSGPVHISANHMLLDEDDLSDEDDFEGEMEDIRRKVLGGNNVDAKGDGTKKRKSAAAEEDDDDLDDDLDDDEDDENILSVDEFLDMEAEAEDEDEISDEEEKVQEVAPKKRKLANGQAKAEKKAEVAAKKQASPEKAKQKKPEQKTPKTPKNETPKTPKNEAAQKTPKSEKKTPAKPKFNSVEDVKAAIKKFPGGKPRKQDKFTNWLENQFKVDQDSWKTDLWMWHKKEQGL